MSKLSTTLQLAISALPFSIGRANKAMMDLSVSMQPLMKNIASNHGNTLSQKGIRKRNRQMIGRGVK